MGKYSQERMDIIKNFSETFYEHYLRKPYISEIAAGTSLAKSTVHRYLTKMDEEGILRYDGDSMIDAAAYLMAT